MRRPLFIARQSREPKGWLGGIIARVMERETATENIAAVAMLGLKPEDRVIDVGTGHGRALNLLAAFAHCGPSVGVDHSALMCKRARANNRSLIKAGRVRVEQADSGHMPFQAGMFDAAISIHTLYFLDPAEPHLAEIARVLRSGGRFVIGFRPGEDPVAAAQFPPPVYHFRTTPEVAILLSRSGFDVLAEQRADHTGKSTVLMLAQCRERR